MLKINNFFNYLSKILKTQAAYILNYIKKVFISKGNVYLR